jgi:hypothetical protein
LLTSCGIQETEAKTGWAVGWVDPVVDPKTFPGWRLSLESANSMGRSQINYRSDTQRAKWRAALAGRISCSIRGRSAGRANFDAGLDGVSRLAWWKLFHKYPSERRQRVRQRTSVYGISQRDYRPIAQNGWTPCFGRRSRLLTIYGQVTVDGQMRKLIRRANEKSCLSSRLSPSSSGLGLRMQIARSGQFRCRSSQRRSPDQNNEL